MKRVAIYHSYSDSELVSLLVTGNHRAFTEIYDRHAKPLYHHAYRVLENADACNDVVQDVFLTLWNKRETLRIKGTLSAYLYRAVRNRTLDHISHQQVSKKYIDSIREFVNNRSWSVEEELQEKELLAIIASEKDKLSPRVREIYELNREYGMTYREIGDQLDISEKTVKKTVHNALRRIRLRITSILTIFL